MLQAKPGRSGKQEQEQNSPNLAKAFEPTPVHLCFPLLLSLAHTTYLTLVSSYDPFSGADLPLIVDVINGSSLTIPAA